MGIRTAAFCDLAKVPVRWRPLPGMKTLADQHGRNTPTGGSRCDTKDTNVTDLWTPRYRRSLTGPLIASGKGRPEEKQQPG